MDKVSFRQLLFEAESTTLDFKREQYRFQKATEEEKSELLKDLLGFANAFRRSNAYILIGVEEVRGGEAKVLGINLTDHLDDHSLQQFVTNLINKPLGFHYEAFDYEGKQVGIICIEQQKRPFYLKRDFGKLKKEAVYVRRGSSTDVTKPAKPDEIALMGDEASPKNVNMRVGFADLEADILLGMELERESELIIMPSKNIPDFPHKKESAPWGLPMASLYNVMERPNNAYWRELAEYIAVDCLFVPLRLCVENIGQFPASEVLAEIIIPSSEVRLKECYEIPSLPCQYHAFPYEIPGLQESIGHYPGQLYVEKNDRHYRLEIELGNLQPGRKIFTDVFYLARESSGAAVLNGRIFSGSLSSPQDFTLKVDIAVEETRIAPENLLDFLMKSRKNNHD